MTNKPDGTTHYAIIYGDVSGSLVVYRNGQFFAAIESTTASCDLVQGLIKDYQAAIAERDAALEEIHHYKNVIASQHNSVLATQRWRKMAEEMREILVTKYTNCVSPSGTAKDALIDNVLSKYEAMLGDKPEGE